MHGLWPLAGRRTVRVADALLTFCLTAAVLPGAWLTPRGSARWRPLCWPWLGHPAWQAAALALSPSRLDWQKRHAPGLRGRFVVGLVVNSVLATVVGVAGGLAVGAALALGAAGCPPFGRASHWGSRELGRWAGLGYQFSVAAGLCWAPSTAVSPPDSLHDGTLSTGWVHAVSTGLFGGLAVGGTVALLLEPRTGLVVGAAHRCRIRPGIGSQRRAALPGLSVVLAPTAPLSARPLPGLGLLRPPHALFRSRVPIPTRRTAALARCASRSRGRALSTFMISRRLRPRRPGRSPSPGPGAPSAMRTAPA